MEIPAQFHFRYNRMVEFADTDVAGIMHFSNVFRFVECAEHAFFRSIGFPVHIAEGIRQEGWPRIEVSCRYHRPARFEQVLEVNLRLEEIRTSSLRYTFWIFAADDPAGPIASGAFSIIHVAIENHGRDIRKLPIPPALRAKLSSLIGT